MFDLDGGNAQTLLDIRAQVSTAGNKEGLLSVALDPVNYGGAITVALDPTFFRLDPFARIFPGTTVRTDLFSSVPPPSAAFQRIQEPPESERWITRLPSAVQTGAAFGPGPKVKRVRVVRARS